MDAKVNNSHYPVYMIDDNYGGRGLNFRAPSNPHGITMLILGTFLGEKTRIQVLQRVGRFGDKCTRIRDETIKEFDDHANADKKGMISKFLKKLQKLKYQAGLRGEGIKSNSPTEFEDRYLESEDYKLKAQNNILINLQKK